MGGIGEVALSGKRLACRIQCMNGPVEIARDQCDLGQGHHTTRMGERVLLSFEGLRGAVKQGFCPVEFAELGHDDATQRQRRRIIAQRDVLESGENIAPGQRVCCRPDQRVHWNPVTFVTPLADRLSATMTTTPLF